MPKIVDHEAYRRALLDDSFEVFARRGFTVTMRGIATALGVSTGTLYHYFSTKDDIFQQMVAQVSTETLGTAVERVQSASGRSERLLALLEYVEEQEQRFRYLLFSVMDVVRQPESSDSANLVRNVVRSFRAALTEQLALSPERGDLLFDLLVGAVLNRALDPAGASVKEQLTDGALTLFV